MPAPVIVERWRSFWFSEQRPTTLTWLRVATGLVVAVWASVLVVDAPFFFPGVGAELVRWPGPDWLLASTLRWDLAGAGVCVAVALAGCALVIGRAPRTAAVTAFLGVSILLAANPFVFNTGDRILRGVLFALAVAPLHRTPGWRRPVVPGTRVPAHPLRIVQLITSVGYTASVLHKLQGTPWVDGTAVAGLVRHDDMVRFMALPDLLLELPGLIAVMTYATVGLQAALVVLLWWRRTRYLAIIAGVGFHLAIDLVLVVGFFAPVMLLLYLSFVDGATLERFQHRAATVVQRDRTVHARSELVT